jgi:xanthine dehydrogenase YagR molybdenum-binding subunit
MATAWPEKRRLIGTKVPRVDGPAKATGKARYSFDINRPGLLHGLIVRCPHAHASIKSLDTSAAEKMPGVKAVHVIAKEGTELFFAGDEVVGLAADTEEHARDAARAVKIDYNLLPFLVIEEDALKGDKKTAPPVGPQKERENVRPPKESSTDGFEEGLKKADVVVEGVYGVATICHQCLESHGLVAEWDQEGGLTVWASTQAVTGTAQALARHFSAQKIDLPESKVKCITHYMGGGFGSKFGPDIQGIVAAELARKAKAPVKMMLDRAEEITVGGVRPSAYGTVKMGGTKDGKVTAYAVDCYGSPGVGNSPTVGPLPYVYPFENKTKHTFIRLNTQVQRAMRAPGHPQSCFLTDCALDDLAAKLDLDPLAVRLKNLPPNDPEAAQNAPLSLAALRNTIYTKQIEIAAKAIGWKEKWHPPGKTKGPIKQGIGMALHTWGGQASPQVNECRVIIGSDGTVTARTSTQDLGTAQRTVTSLVVAEILGLEPGQVYLQIGESQYGKSSGSGGSTTCPSQAPAALRAATAARDDLFEKIAKKLGADKGDLAIEVGKVVDTKKKKSWAWKEACARLGMERAEGVGDWKFADSTRPENKAVSNVGVGGVQVAEVLVDTETGVVRCTRIVAVQDCGLVVNKLTCESQVAGGVIMGVNYALFEERIMDRHTGRQVNPDMEFYKLGGLEDMPKIDVILHDMPERGVIGVGEPPTISTHAAIANAIHNAIGVRVPYTPFSPDRVLAALAGKGGKGA